MVIIKDFIKRIAPITIVASSAFFLETIVCAEERSIGRFGNLQVQRQSPRQALSDYGKGIHIPGYTNTTFASGFNTLDEAIIASYDSKASESCASLVKRVDTDGEVLEVAKRNGIVYTAGLGDFQLVNASGSLLGSIALPKNSIITDIFIPESGDKAYLASPQDGLLVVGIGNSSKPTLDKTIKTSTFAGKVVVNNKIYVARSGLEILDKENYSSLGTAALSGIAGGMDVKERIVCITDFAAEKQGLKIFDANDSSKPKEIGFYETTGIPMGVAFLDKNTVCITESDLDSKKGYFNILDISKILDGTSTTPELIGKYETTNMAKGLAVDKSNNRAYITNLTELLTIDIAELSRLP